ncbi:MAG: nodulation protein NfeD [Caldimicrobium sp.]|nr:nodulation protein NfeD [Caldimicrobium sp.]MCX7873625.1 nodulation protein NfeD [Caldimicrobium sp.]MDW8094429.1 nodulation protein NfeD [Caldimicrobium sp.]
MRVLRLIFLIICVWLAQINEAFSSQGANSQGAIYHVKIDSAITPVTANFLSYALNYAQEKKGRALIIELDTPGGLVDSTREIVKEFLQSELPVVVYVSPRGARAASAGVFILLASHVAAMAPSTHVGAAHPVELTGKADPKMLEKIANDLTAWAKNLAEMRGRNSQFAELAVKESKSITEREALEQGVIEIIAENLEDLIKKLEGRKVKVKEQELLLTLKNAPVETIKEDFKTRFLKVLANPNLVYFLLMLGLLGIYFELSHPGSIFPGVFGAICLILAFLGLSIIPMNYAGLALILLAGLLFFLETQVTSHGLLTIGAIISLLLGSLILFGHNPPALRVYKPFLFTVVTTFAVLFGGVTYLAVKTLRKRPVSGGEGLIKKTGKALSNITPNEGKVFIEGEIWDAISDEEIPKGTKVEVVEKIGFTLRVRPIN